MKKILIIENEKELVLAMATMLKAKGYQVNAAYDGMFGISLAHKEKPELIITDIGLPAGGGFYVLENLKNSVATNDIPVLVMTAMPEKELEEKAVNMGAAGFIRKPFEPDLLLSMIHQLLDGGGKQVA